MPLLISRSYLEASRRIQKWAQCQPLCFKKGRTEFRPSRADPKKPRGEIKQGVRFQPQISERGLQNTARTEFSSSRSQRAKGLVSRNEGTTCNLRNRIEQITRNQGSDYKRKCETSMHGRNQHRAFLSAYTVHCRKSLAHKFQIAYGHQFSY